MSQRFLSGKTALVTGSSDGLGLAMAQGLARAGCNVALHGIGDEAATREQQALIEREHGVVASYVRADLAHPDEIEAMIRTVESSHGAIDILVNNAVTREFAPIESFPVDAWDRALAVNVSAAFHAVRLSLPAMRRRGWGRIVNMCSVYGSRGVANRIDYVTSKAALQGMTRAVAVETLHDGITCNAICPGTVLTPGIETRVRALMRDKGIDFDEASREFLKGKQPNGHFVEAAHVADMLVFLCGPAARDITGSVLPMEGGWLAA